MKPRRDLGTTPGFTKTNFRHIARFVTDAGFTGVSENESTGGAIFAPQTGLTERLADR
jgi:hypothetical protein